MSFGILSLNIKCVKKETESFDSISNLCIIPSSLYSIISLILSSEANNILLPLIKNRQSFSVTCRSILGYFLITKIFAPDFEVSLPFGGKHSLEEHILHQYVFLVLSNLNAHPSHNS